MPIRIQELHFSLRGLPENLSPIAVKQHQIRYGLELMTSLFRVIGLISFEQAGLHNEANRLANAAKIEEIDRALELVGDFGASIADCTAGYADELSKLISGGSNQ